jgi:hypothetical protein
MKNALFIQSALVSFLICHTCFYFSQIIAITLIDKTTGSMKFMKVLVVSMVLGLGVTSVLAQSVKKQINQQAKQLSPQDGKALVYFYQDDGGKKLDVSIDGSELGSVDGKEFMFVMLEPGGHLINSGKVNITLNAEEGKTYFFHQEGKKDIAEVEEYAGRLGLSKCDLIKDMYKMIKDQSY